MREHADRKSNASEPGVVPDQFQERFARLPAAAKKRFLENWSRWRRMDADEREKLMERALNERQRREEIIDRALADLGLELTPDRREVFQLRYRQERRKLEEQLRDEVAKMRESRLEAMLDSLGAEFSDEKKSASLTGE